MKKNPPGGSSFGMYATVALALAGGVIITGLPPLLEIGELAKLFRSHPRTIKRLIADDKIKAHRPTPNKTLVVTESVQTLLDETTVMPSDIEIEDDDGDGDGDDTFAPLYRVA